MENNPPSSTVSSGTTVPANKQGFLNRFRGRRRQRRVVFGLVVAALMAYFLLR